MKHAEENIDWSQGIRPLESYAIASLLGCGALCMAAVVVGLVAIAIVRWL
jgi:hypothetical protein